MNCLCPLFPAVLLTAVLLTASSAGGIKVPLIGLGWQIAFEAPVLRESSVDYPDGAIQFRGNSGRFNVSLFVEPTPVGAANGTNATHSGCRDFYWAEAKRNPAIVESSVKLSTRPNCEVVEYRVKGVHQDMPYVQDGLHCYFVHQGKWVDLHASVLEPTDDDTKLLQELAARLTYGPLETSKGRIEKFSLGKIGAVSLAPPAGWIVGNVLRNDTEGFPTRFNLTFCSPTDPNSNCLLTLCAVPVTPDSREALYRAVESSTQSAVRISVEGKAVVRDIKLKQGLGAVATFTDASLVGKPVKPGNAKAIVSGLMVLKPRVLTVVGMFTDDAQGPDAKKMLQVLETLKLE